MDLIDEAHTKGFMRAKKDFDVKVHHIKEPSQGADTVRKIPLGAGIDDIDDPLQSTFKNKMGNRGLSSKEGDDSAR